jgi:DNA-binding CsgD family transcriptional regulator
VHVLAALGHALMLGWRHDESREVCERALELAREIGARRSAFRALAVLGVDLAYLGRGEEGLGCLWEALDLAEDLGVPEELGRAYTLLTDVLTMLGRPRESVQVAATGIALARRYGREHGRNMPLAVNLMEALFDLGEWEEADRVGAAAIRAGGAPWPHQRLVARAVLDIGRGDYDRARVGLQAALATVHDDKRGLAAFDIARAELALWERRWDDAEHAAGEALQRPPIVAYCRWRQAEALVAAGAPAADAAPVARDALAVARRLGARPLQEEIERLARRARLDLAPPARPAGQGSGLADLLGLTPREAKVLGLVARGYSNGQIAAALVISVKTASVHVSHILAKLQVQNRVEAAAIAHRLDPATTTAPKGQRR